MYYYVDLVLRIGRLLGTIRSLIVQTVDLIDYVGLNDNITIDLDSGHEF